MSHKIRRLKQIINESTEHLIKIHWTVITSNKSFSCIQLYFSNIWKIDFRIFIYFYCLFIYSLVSFIILFVCLHGCSFILFTNIFTYFVYLFIYHLFLYHLFVSLVILYLTNLFVCFPLP